MYNIDIIERIESKYQEFLPYLNERTKRVWSGIEARALGHGGIASVSKATGLNRSTIRAGIKEVETSKGKASELTEIRKSGGGRKQIEAVDEILDEGIYDTGIKVSDAEFNSISLHKRRFHGDWNYQISPNL